ncbi:MAG: class I SAM-dependent methyltransferase [Pseudomonadota bacterium]
MTVHLDPAGVQAAETYDGAAGHVDAPPCSFAVRHGHMAVELAHIRQGHAVLDVGCGSGASALKAAQVVAPSGHVLAVDVAANMLYRADQKAAARGLTNIDFVCDDMGALDGPAGHYHAVIGVFSLVFVSDMPRVLHRLYQLLRPGGRIVITSWADGAFEPLASAFRRALRKTRPDVLIDPLPWRRLSEPDAIDQLFRMAGLPEPQLHHVADHHIVADIRDHWTVVMGSVLRTAVACLTPEERFEVEEDTIGELARGGADAIGASVIHAVAQKPAI